MRFVDAITLAASVAGAVAAPFKFPLPDGFPTPNPAQLVEIEHLAGGTLANSFLPTSLKDAAITVLELLAHNEYSEAAFFNQLLANITNNVFGFDAAATSRFDRTYLINTITAIAKQEEVHTLGANGILVGAKQAPIAPCLYHFPVQDFVQAIELAQTFTDIALGTIPEVQLLFGTDGGEEPRNIPLLGSILGQEAEQVGFFRYVLRKTPSAAPFLTGGSPSFAFTQLQKYIVPGSCPKPLSTINLTTFQSLTVLPQPKPQARNMTLTYSVEAGSSQASPIDPTTQSLVYLSGQNLPLTVPIQPNPIHLGGNCWSFKASFPFQAGFANGLTIAAVVNGTGSFLSPDAVAEATVFGPGIIEVN